MGITLHYRGKLKSPKLIEPLIEEMAALAQEASWKYHEFGPKAYDVFDRISVKLRGVFLQVHPDCETLHLVFDQEGHLVFRGGLEIVARHGFMVETEDEYGKSVSLEMPPREKLAQLTWHDLLQQVMVKTAFTKTQFAGAETHILLCKLLRYLEKKYFAALEVIDEGGYYLTGDASKLGERMAYLNFIIDNVGKPENMALLQPLPENATLEERLQELSRYLHAIAERAPIKPWDKDLAPDET